MEETRWQCRAQGRRARLIAVVVTYGLGIGLLVAVGIHDRSLAVVPPALSALAMVAVVVWASTRRPRVTANDTAAPTPLAPVDYRTAPQVTARSEPARWVWSANARRLGWGALFIVLLCARATLSHGDGIEAFLLSIAIVSSMFGVGWVVLRLHRSWRRRRNVRLELELERKIGLIR